MSYSVFSNRFHLWSVMTPDRISSKWGILLFFYMFLNLMFNQVIAVLGKLAVLGGSSVKKCKSNCWCLFSFLNSRPRVCLKRKWKADICAILPWEQKKIKVLGSLKDVCVWAACSAWHVRVVPWLCPQLCCKEGSVSIRTAIPIAPCIGSVKQQLSCIMVWHCVTVCDLGKAQPK